MDAADHSCLRANPNPYQIQDTDYQKLDRDDSRVHFLLRKQGDQPALLPDDLLDAPVRKSQISEVESGPASAVNASNKEQLWDLFQDFIRKQAPVPLPAPLPAPVPFPAQTDSLKQLNDTIGNLASFLRVKGGETSKGSRRDQKKKTRPGKQAPL